MKVSYYTFLQQLPNHVYKARLNYLCEISVPGVEHCRPEPGIQRDL
uniref:Uncharacterized protein n=1 Tax=Anguilla anguilla TaxID=7936 RepID=A0A0E9SZS7_ANGAN